MVCKWHIVNLIMTIKLFKFLNEQLKREQFNIKISENLKSH